MHVYTKNIGKTFSGVNVLREVEFNLEPGEVHALVGENGAGKSTFAKVLSGVYTPTEGDIFLDDKKAQINTPIAAQKNGISLIHQEPQSFSHLSVAENIFMGHMEGNNFSRVKWKDINKSSEKILLSIGLEIDPKNSTIIINLANAYISSGNFNLAKKFTKLANEMEPYNLGIDYTLSNLTSYSIDDEHQLSMLKKIDDNKLAKTCYSKF